MPPTSIELATTVLAPIGPTEPLDDVRRAGIIVDDGPRGAVAVVRVLDSPRILPDTLVVREPTLDDVFLQLTGRRAEEQIGEAAA